MAVRVAFSNGSPTKPSSSWTSEWQVAKTCTVSFGASFIGMTAFGVLLVEKNKKSEQLTANKEQKCKAMMDSLYEKNMAMTAETCTIQHFLT